MAAEAFATITDLYMPKEETLRRATASKRGTNSRFCIFDVRSIRGTFRSADLSSDPGFDLTKKAPTIQIIARGIWGVRSECNTLHINHRSTAMWFLLLIPFIGLLWVPFYNFQEPALFGFPFFYWYQLAWVPISSVLIWLVYRRQARSEKN